MDTLIDALPSVCVFKDALINLPAYKWLLSSVQKVLYLTVPDGTPVGIREVILEYLPKVRWSDTPQRHSLTFSAKWDPCSFLDEQEYPENPEVALERAFTISGSTTDAQAVTVAEYLRQTWPAMGHYFIRIMKEVVQGDFDTPYTSR
jgi:hypothetical protein